MRKLLLAACVALMIATAASAACATLCWIENRDSFAARLFSKYGELPVCIGKRDGEDELDWTIEVLATPNEPRPK